MEFLKTCRLPATKTPSMSDSAIEIGSQQYAPVCAPSGPACGRDGSLGHNPNPELLEELAVRIRGWQRRVIDVAPFTGLVRTGGGDQTIGGVAEEDTHARREIGRGAAVLPDHNDLVIQNGREVGGRDNGSDALKR